MNRFAIIITFFSIACYPCKEAQSDKVKFKTEQSGFENTGLKETIDSLVSAFSQHGHGRNKILIEGKSEMFTVDSLSALLLTMRHLDKTNHETFVVFKKMCSGIENVSWKPKDEEEHSLQVTKKSYQGKYFADDHTIQLKITDFEIYSGKGELIFMLRVVQDYIFEQLFVRGHDYRLNTTEKLIDGVFYKPMFEDRLLGLDEILKEYETKKQSCKTLFH